MPPTTSARAHSDEVVIRANAVESLVQRLSSSESTQFLKEVIAKTGDPALAKHARYWLNRVR